jgi:DNA-directed RNA polymerase subunit RPC12/RpoP
MSHREAYVPPVRQTDHPNGAGTPSISYNGANTPTLSYNGASTPSISQNGASTLTPRNSSNSSSGSDDNTPVLAQSPTRRTNIVSAAETSASLNQPQAAPAAAAAQAQARMNAGRAAYDTPDEKVYYVCGACNMPCGFKSNDMLRCLNCGGVTMFKPRVKGYVAVLQIED